MVELRIPGAFWAELKSLGLIAEAAPTPRAERRAGLPER